MISTYDEWFAQTWDAAERAGRCPVCATGNSHTSSRCPEGNQDPDRARALRLEHAEAAKEAIDLGIEQRRHALD